ncbi:MAG: ParB/RepB/Spo0J family partition protein, partial [Candidatus Omnitrophica bacterium]|nr:ParB/RepB/Spo0J family partition protein [Candidatus Omnitrophota bacterium]
MDKKKALGKGLSALIPEDVIKREVERQDASAMINLNVNEIQPSRFQPREDFNDEKLKELIASIQEKGFLQPILVHKTAEGYELIAGERRLRAAKSLGMSEIPAIVKSVSDEDVLVLSIIENVQREELNPIEEA